MQGDREKILNARFDGYRSKPVDSHSLAEELDRPPSKRAGLDVFPDRLLGWRALESCGLGPGSELSSYDRRGSVTDTWRCPTPPFSHPPSQRPRWRVENQVAAPTETRAPNLHRAK